MVKKIALTVFLVVVTLAYWEMGVRVIGKTAFPLLRTDPEVGSIHVKNYSGLAWDALSARKNYIHTNSIGYVGDDVAFLKPTSTIRIAMLGDSGLAALQVDYYNNFTRLLENALNTSGVCAPKHFEVMNFGVGSAGTFTEYQTYKKKIAQFHPDYVFVLFTGNDYDDNMLKSGFDLEHYAEERKSVGLKEFLLQFELPKFIFHKLLANKTFIGTLRIVGIIEGDTTKRQDVLANEPAPASASSTQRYYAYTFDILSKFDDIVTADGARFGVIIFPSEQTDYEQKGAWKSNAHVTKLIEFLASSSIPYFNPADQLALVRSRYGACLNFDCSSHFNEEGHRAMAKILYGYTKDELLKSDPACVNK
jgi:lysophospholipase L1-like esterase